MLQTMNILPGEVLYQYLQSIDHDEAVVGDELVYLLPVEVLYQYLQR